MHPTPTYSPETAHAAPPAAIRVGTVRRFGPYGVLYEIVRPIDDQSFLIRVLDTGEELAYPRDKILADPRD
jgi:hypothetical protein